MEIILFGPSEREETVDITVPSGELDIHSEDYTFEDGIGVVCRIQRNDDLVRVDGEVSARVDVQCARCLEPFSKDVRGTFSFLVKRMPPGIPVPEGTPEEPDEEQEFVYVGHDTVVYDITGVVREAVILALPMRLLCREDCKGLCAVCGGNRNEADCGCRPEQEDARWKGLDKLFEKKK